MKRLFSAYVILFALVALVGGNQSVRGGDKKGPPAIQILGLDEVQENNTMKWKIKVLAEGATLNKVTLDILPKGGKKLMFGDPEPLPSGRGQHEEFKNPMVVDGVFEEKGEVKKLPPGGYYVVVIVTYNGNKKMYNSHTPTVTGAVQQLIGEISEDMEFSPAILALSNRMAVHGKYAAPNTNNALSVKKFTATLLGPTVALAEVEDILTAPKYHHKFSDLPGSGLFRSYVRAEVYNSANRGEKEGWVYTTRHEKKVP